MSTGKREQRIKSERRLLRLESFRFQIETIRLRAPALSLEDVLSSLTLFLNKFRFPTSYFRFME